MNTLYDAIVVGAGIAGASAAFFLKRQGFRVLVLERKELPRYKACGGAIPRAVLRRFPFSFQDVIEQEIGEVVYHFRGRMPIRASLPLEEGKKPFVMVMRDRLDTHVLRQADVTVEAGTTVDHVEEAGDRVVVSTRDGGRYQGRYLVGSDGATSVVARSLGILPSKKPDMGVALEAEVEANAKVMKRYQGMALFDFGTVQDGYFWIFPKARHLSVGVGSLRAGKGVALSEALRNGLERFGFAAEPLQIHSHPLPSYSGPRALHTSRALLVGDAAGVVGPVLGEGIRYGVKTSELAAEAIAVGDLAGYDRRVHEVVGRSLQEGRRWAAVFYRWPRLSYRLGVRNQLLLPDMVRLLNDRMDYRDLSYRAPKYALGCLLPPRAVDRFPKV
jgi:geranylgeranyl reductase family protein